MPTRFSYDPIPSTVEAVETKAKLIQQGPLYCDIGFWGYFGLEEASDTLLQMIQAGCFAF